MIKISCQNSSSCPLQNPTRKLVRARLLSLMWIRNNGASTVACGTQEVTGGEDVLPSKTILWYLSALPATCHCSSPVCCRSSNSLAKSWAACYGHRLKRSSLIEAYWCCWSLRMLKFFIRWLWIMYSINFEQIEVFYFPISKSVLQRLIPSQLELCLIGYDQCKDRKYAGWHLLLEAYSVHLGCLPCVSTFKCSLTPLFCMLQISVCGLPMA